ncbi:MAG TPA: hypoxanthine phosphoribosyltransferase [Thermodesulfovibrionales bacterium]|nr:hypoxanthine phosphoribosyltransferase [Thermodesulfovibrionales bacterium]
MIVGKPIFSAEQIQNRVKELGDRISGDYQGKDLLVVGILRGAFMFMSDLVRAIKVPLTVDFVMAASYIKTNTSGEVHIYCDIREEMTGRDILLVEDIADTGITLNYLKERILQEHPSSLKICAFLNKRERRTVDVNLDYVGFEVPNEYVVGYGLDYENKYRNLPYIAAFRKTV